MEHRLERATSTTVENVYANAIFPFVRRAPRPCDTVPIFNSINMEIRFDGIEDELGVNAPMSPGGLSLFTNRSGIKRSDNDRKFPRRWEGIEGGQGSIVKSMEGTLHTFIGATSARFNGLRGCLPASFVRVSRRAFLLP